MKWNFLGFENWPAASGVLDMMQAFDVFRASLSTNLPRSMCEGCVCWRVFGTCCQVQVEDHEEDKAHRESYAHVAMPTGCLAFANCCPILFFDFIGQPLPELVSDEANAGGQR